MSPDQVTQFTERLATVSSNVDSIMTYTHLFTNGGVVVVFDDSLFSYQPMDFKVGLGFPTIAKILVVIIVLLLTGSYFLIRFIVRRVRLGKTSQVSN